MNIKIDITVPQTSQGTSSANQKGVLKSETEDEYLPRRGGPLQITVYDTALLNTGTEEHPDFTDTPLERDINFNFIIAPGDDNYRLQSFDNFKLPEWQAWADKLLEVPIKDWKKKYYRIPYDNESGIDIYVGPIEEMSSGHIDYHPLAKKDSRYPMVDPPPAIKIGDDKEWIDPGILKLKKATNNFTFLNGLGFPNLTINPGFTRWKITKEYDFSAPSVTNFKFQGDMHIFPIPMPLIQLVDSHIFDIRPPGTLMANWVYPGVYKPVSRQHYKNYTDFEAIYDLGLLEMYSALSDDHNLSDSLFGELTDYNKTITGAQLRKTNQDIIPAYGPGDLSEFTVLNNSFFRITNYIDNGFGDGHYGVFLMPGALQMVMMRGKDIFYVWFNEDFPDFRDYQFALSTPV